MPRRRSPTPEIQAQDRNIASGIVTVLTALAERYPTAGLNAAAGVVETFVESSPDYPRLRRPAAHANPDAVAAWEEAVTRSLEAVAARQVAEEAERQILEHDNPVETDQ
jgi:hypothetical protein